MCTCPQVHVWQHFLTNTELVHLQLHQTQGQHSLGLYSSRVCVISQRQLCERKFTNSPTPGKAFPELTLHYPSVWKTAHSISPMLMELFISFMRDWIFLIWSHTVSVLLPINSTADSIPVLYQLGHLPDRHSNKCCKYHQLMQRAAPVPLLLLSWKDVRTFSESILTLKSKSVSVKFLCRAEDKYWTVVTMILQPKTKRRKQKENIWIWNTHYYSDWWCWFYYRYRE